MKGDTHRPRHRPGTNPTTPEEQPVGTRRFWLLATALSVALALIAAVLAFVAVVRGPDLVSASISPTRSVTVAGERLRLRSRQPLAEVSADQVRIEPAVPCTVTTKDSTLTIRFTAPLSYDTRYTVTVSDARSRDTGTTLDWTYAFSTPSASLYTLLAHRGDTAAATVDAVLRASSEDTDTSAPADTALAAERLSQFTVAGGRIVAVSQPEAEAPRLVTVPATATSPTSGDGTTSPGTTSATADAAAVQTPAASTIDQLRASPDGARFGYVVSGRDTTAGTTYVDALFVQDAGDLAAAPLEIADSGTPFSVQDWRFVPGVAAVVVLTTEGRAYLVYLDADTAPVTLGSFAQLIDFLPGTTTLAVMSNASEVLIDLTTGTTSPVAATVGETETAIPGRRTELSADGYLMELNQIEYGGGTTRITTRLVHVSAGRTTTIAEVGPDEGEVQGSGVSPNGQYAWMTVLDPDAPVEDFSSGASDHATTTVYDLATGRQVAQVRGSGPSWGIA